MSKSERMKWICGIYIKERRKTYKIVNGPPQDNKPPGMVVDERIILK
jgi:hypothetical protein